MEKSQRKPDFLKIPGAPDAPGNSSRTGSAGAEMGDALGEYLARFLEHEPGALTGADPEELHDYRVALRRARSVLWGGRNVFPSEELELLRSLSAWMAGPTSLARDLDVLTQEFPDMVSRVSTDSRRGSKLLGDELERRRQGAYEALRDAVASHRHDVLLRRWETFAAFAALDELHVGPDALRPAPEVVAERLERAFRRVRKSGKAAMRSNDRNDWHSLRKDLKRFRYLLAAFSGVFPKGAVDRVIVDLAELQEHLGRLQDRRVQAAIVSDAGLEVGGRSALVAGAIAEALRRSEDKAHRRCYRAYRRFEHSGVRAELAKLSA